MKLLHLAFSTCSSMYRNLEREKLLCLLKLFMKEQQLLEREQLFAVQRLLAQKLSTKTEHLLSVRFMKRERKFQGSYEVSGDPVCKSVNSYEGEPKEVALAILFELFIDPVAAQTCLEILRERAILKLTKQTKKTNGLMKMTVKSWSCAKRSMGPRPLTRQSRQDYPFEVSFTRNLWNRTWERLIKLRLKRSMIYHVIFEKNGKILPMLWEFVTWQMT